MSIEILSVRFWSQREERERTTVCVESKSPSSGRKWGCCLVWGWGLGKMGSQGFGQVVLLELSAKLVHEKSIKSEGCWWRQREGGLCRHKDSKTRGEKRQAMWCVIGAWKEVRKPKIPFGQGNKIKNGCLHESQFLVCLLLPFVREHTWIFRWGTAQRSNLKAHVTVQNWNLRRAEARRPGRRLLCPPHKRGDRGGWKEGREQIQWRQAATISGPRDPLK